MALSSSSLASVLIDNSTLSEWRLIGSGGFGQIYKARHVPWGRDVAIKLLHYDDGNSSSLLGEADKMRQGGSTFVLRVLGVFQGQLSPDKSMRLGLVMEFMERGSLANLQETLCGPPPWPLAFRLAHQVALGMNYLHSLLPPLLHLDLKPNNVLLDFDLNVKLTDFGLARYYHSVTRGSAMQEEGGTISYMPPEAFSLSYHPTKASDVYSYGILLWSIVTGKEPYSYTIPPLVRILISEGQRPDMKMIDVGQAEGLRDLVVLMERCWDMISTLRPSFQECASMAENLYEIHKRAIIHDIYQVKLKLDKQEETRTEERVSLFHITQKLVCSNVMAQEVSNHVAMPSSPTQEIADDLRMSQRSKPSSKGQPASKPPRDLNAGSIHLSTNHKSKGSSSSSIRVPNWPTSQDRTTKPFQSFNKPSQVSNPGLPSQHVSPFPLGTWSIHMSNVTGLQVGNDNYMCIDNMGGYQRRRHRTAPPSVSVSPPN